MREVIGRTAAELNGSRFSQETPGPLAVERDHFDASLRTLGRCLASRQMSSDAATRLLQGPLADVMTHVGQIALLRRLAGSPIPPENFYTAAIDVDDLAGTAS